MSTVRESMRVRGGEWVNVFYDPETEDVQAAAGRFAWEQDLADGEMIEVSMHDTVYAVSDGTVIPCAPGGQSAQPIRRRPQVQTIQRTSKGLKLQLLIAGLLMAGSVVYFLLAMISDRSLYPILGIYVFLPSFAWFTGVKILAWWHHG